MRPFFSYYGAKYTVAAHLGPPRRSIVIEPFAGSACYSTRWNVRIAKLFDVSPDICALWDFLIRSSDADIARIPDTFESIDEVRRLAVGPSLLVRFWIAKGRAEPSGAISPWYRQYRSETDCRVWGPMVKERIRRQKPGIARWTVQQSSYRDIANEEAHWHIDPPYQGAPGRRYPHADVDFSHLAEWSRSRWGAVDVCENVGADWMPFQHLTNVTSSRGRRDGHQSAEAVWRAS